MMDPSLQSVLRKSVTVRAIPIDRALDRQAKRSEGERSSNSVLLDSTPLLQTYGSGDLPKVNSAVY